MNKKRVSSTKLILSIFLMVVEFEIVCITAYRKFYFPDYVQNSSEVMKAVRGQKPSTEGPKKNEGVDF